MSKCKRYVISPFKLSQKPVFDQNIQEILLSGRNTFPNTGHEHFQGFVVFRNKQNLFLALILRELKQL